jgi:subtilisin family serine protease
MVGAALVRGASQGERSLEPRWTEVVPGETILVDGAKKSEAAWLRDRHGVEQVEEGLEGKTLFRVPEDGQAAVVKVFRVARELFERGKVRAAHPNFERALTQLSPSEPGTNEQWNHDNPGNPGLPGADVHVRAAWTITQGSPEVAVAVLDEGVDTSHPALQAALLAERDFVDGNASARPDGDDAHGTACAGIIASRSPSCSGLAPKVALIAVRIAQVVAKKWVVSDFQVADGIDWAWRQGAAVLSNSWCGGPSVDGIRLAFERARKLGRKGKGSVVIVAAGNRQQPVGFPGTLRGVLTVGASNQWDEPKTLTSKDSESWWGSNYGAPVRLLAPGVQIPTTDISGPRGYGPEDFTARFNGTSAATPHVAAAAALLLSVAPDLTEKRVREILIATSDRLPGHRELGNSYGRGRLNLYAALRAARRG